MRQSEQTAINKAKAWWYGLNPVARSTIQWKANITNINDRNIERMYVRYHNT